MLTRRCIRFSPFKCSTERLHQGDEGRGSDVEGERVSGVECRGEYTGPGPARGFSLVPRHPSLAPFSQELTEKTELLLKFISVLSVVIMEDWRNGMLERWNDAAKVSLFHYSSVPVFQVPRHSSLDTLSV